MWVQFTHSVSATASSATGFQVHEEPRLAGMVEVGMVP